MLAAKGREVPIRDPHNVISTRNEGVTRPGKGVTAASAMLNGEQMASIRQYPRLRNSGVWPL